jgi:DNA-binding IclR family transcriptional regulator
VDADWTFFSNHAHVLFCLAAEPDLRIRDVATRVGITERAAQRIVAELAADGFLVVVRTGRRNRYTVPRALPLRHPVEAHRTVGQLLTWLTAAAPVRRKS